MKIAVVAAALLLTFGVTQAVRYLKEGPVVDAQGREYKSTPLRAEEEGLAGLASAVRVHCTHTAMTVGVKANLFKPGRLVPPGELFLGETPDPQCQAADITEGEYVIVAQLQDCGSTSTVSWCFYWQILAYLFQVLL